VNFNVWLRFWFPGATEPKHRATKLSTAMKGERVKPVNTTTKPMNVSFSVWLRFWFPSATEPKHRATELSTAMKGGRVNPVNATTKPTNVSSGSPAQ